ncbi:SET domain-containing protein 4-like isoform X2 [Osmerus eperlanus]|uniref:SET domain-containing protein 4-like isoform X2 n=1 Tax=Osmerus eperlanus TaxID=29151 RepID=UPI002E12FFE0
MARRSGRRARRKRRKREGVAAVQSVTLSHEPPFVCLRRWLQKRGFSSRLLLPAHFSDTGRGLLSLTALQPGELLISLPESCLLTTSTVLKSYLGQYIKRWQPRVSPLLALCTFLICERHLGEDADWIPYIKVLPTSYTCPAYFSDEVISLLPSGVRERALQQRQEVQELHASSLAFFRSLLPLLVGCVEEVFSLEAVLWAWCSVNTRTVYKKHPYNHSLSRQEDVYALAPYLDLLNHRPDTQVQACFNEVSRCYEVHSLQGCHKFQQAFICYGPHDNQRLLLEYGFVAPDNPHGVVYVEEGLLQKCVCAEGRGQLEQKLLFLKQHDLLQNLTFGVDGPSWRLMTVLRLLSLRPEHYPQWKSVLQGAAVSEETEQLSVLMAAHTCQLLLQDTATILDQISRLREQCDRVLREQLEVVAQLRQEEQGILGSSLDVLRRLQAHSQAE